MDYLQNVDGMAVQLFRAAAMYLNRVKTNRINQAIDDLRERSFEFYRQVGLTAPRNEVEEDAMWILLIAFSAINKIQTNTGKTIEQINTADDVYNAVASEVEW